ncbi:HEAT repeat domain-containing protein [Microcoleus sp. PH2017_05_CCC_O_A]|uniref:HEAT repeat domain-containing protein n=1 Tax=Microcoleus sp. PH2017_05_CCC_O_A TaxID=2798816 RepID=UPI0025DAE864|nr:HEAT repeat domain-containing protein [Microcoleus sp. PH2017_05_CCC_O_A]
MTKHYRQRLVAVIALSFLSFTSPLLLTRNASAENPIASKASSQEINSLIKKLKSNDERELDTAISELGEIGEPAIPALIEALQDENLQVRQSATEVLRQSGRPVIPALVKALTNSDVELRRRAAALLKKVSRSYWNSSELSKVKTVVSQLIPLLQDSDAGVRSRS